MFWWTRAFLTRRKFVSSTIGLVRSPWLEGHRTFWGSYCCYLLRTWCTCHLPSKYTLNTSSCWSLSPKWAILSHFQSQRHQKSWKECESLGKACTAVQLCLVGVTWPLLSLTLSSCDCLQDTHRAAVIPPLQWPHSSLFSAVSGCGGQGQLFSGATTNKMPVPLWRATPTFLGVTCINLVGLQKNKIKIRIFKKLSSEG